MKPRSIRWLLLLLGLCALTFGGGVAFAALPPLDPETLKDDATDVVQAEVVRVYATEQAGQPGFSDMRYAIEMKVQTVRKGEVKAGQVIFARCWQSAKRPERWVGDGGLRGLPQEGDRVLVHLRRRADGSFGILQPTGVARIHTYRGTLEASKAGYQIVTARKTLLVVVSEVVSKAQFEALLGQTVKLTAHMTSGLRQLQAAALEADN